MRSTIWRDGRARLNAPDLKSGVGLNPPGVRIPLSPPNSEKPLTRAAFFVSNTLFFGVKPLIRNIRTSAYGFSTLKKGIKLELLCRKP